MAQLPTDEGSWPASRETGCSKQLASAVSSHDMPPTARTYLASWMRAMTSQRPTSPHTLAAPISMNTSTHSSTLSHVSSFCWDRDCKKPRPGTQGLRPVSRTRCSSPPRGLVPLLSQTECSAPKRVGGWGLVYSKAVSV